MSDDVNSPDPEEILEESEYIDVSSLADIKTAAGPRPDSIILVWRAGGESYKMKVTTRYPENLELFGMQYLEEQERANQAEFDGKGEPTYPNKGDDEMFLRRQCIEKPSWMHNKSAFREFSNKVPPHVLVSLHRKLKLIGGLDADFFTDFRDYTAPAIQRMLSSMSESDSDSSPAKSKSVAADLTAQPTGMKLDDSPSGTASVEVKSDSPESSMTSGSTPSQIPTEARKVVRPHTPSSDSPNEA